MLINFSEAVKKYGMKIRGIIQAGAHWGQEVESYWANGIRKIILIEPCREAFGIIQEKFLADPDIHTLNYALGNYKGFAEMNVETVNNGQSNSILKPKKHLEQHPSIVFHKTEKVAVRKLNNLDCHWMRFNMLVLDAQGYEKNILMGADNVIEFFDYVYSEINFEEVYEDCARVEEIDEILKDFKRVETYRVGGWGDALYIRKTLL